MAKENPSKLQYEIELKKVQLSSLLEITQAINQNFSTEQLFNIYKFVLRTQLKIHKLALFVFDKKWSCYLYFGASSKCEDIDVEKELLHITDIQSVDKTTQECECISEFQTIIPVIHKKKPLAFALIGDYSAQENELKNDLIPFVQTLTNIIIVAIENKKFSREQIQQEGIKKELELAAQMQNMLFPSSLPDNNDVELTATYLPHQEVGGDYYDYIRLINFEFLICMADVSGKGIPAALLMSNFQANLHALANHYASLSMLVTQLNASVFKSAKGEKFITFFIGKFNTKTRELRYINAGHNPPILLVKSSKTETEKGRKEETEKGRNGEIILLEEGTTGLGMFEELPFVKEGTLIVPKESALLCYTDGVVETENAKRDFFGQERLENYCTENILTKTSSDFQQSLIAQLNAFKGKMAFTDDVTLLVCKFK